MLRLALASVVAVATAACASSFPRAALRAPSTSAPSTARGAAAPFPFAGTWHVVGTGFPEGARDAVMAIAERDSGYTLCFVTGGPLGRLLSMRVAGDSAHLRWEIDDGERTDVMTIRMRGVRDSLVGTWAIGDTGGALTGARRT